MALEINPDLCCCAIDEINGIASNGRRIAPETVIALCAATQFEQYSKSAFYLFTDTGNMASGEALREYIHKHDIGTVTPVGPKRNPNTQNLVTVYIWEIDRKALEAWWKTRRRDATVLRDLDNATEGEIDIDWTDIHLNH